MRPILGLRPREKKSERKMTTTSEDIDLQAAEWVARRDAGSLTPEGEAKFEAWLAADVRALGAYCRVEAALSRLERVGRVTKKELAAVRVQNAPAWSRRRFVLTGGVAASIATVGIVGTVLSFLSGETCYATGIGDVREFPLTDGSIITLNTNSEVSVKYTDETRRIHLLRGEALFDVAKNKRRPFVVFAGDTQVWAVGTSFSVSMLPSRPIQVLVKEGIVELKREAKGQMSPIRVNANTRVLSSTNDHVVAANLLPAKVARDLAWQYGRIAFDNQTLHDAANEFARYSDIRINIDPAVAHRTITGLFSSNDPIGFAKLTAAALDLQVEVNDKEVKLSAR